MNNSNFSNDQPNSNTYHAAKNLNTALENPQYDVNNTMAVNIDNTDAQSVPSSVPTYNDFPTSSFQNGSSDFHNETYQSSMSSGYNDFNNVKGIDNNQLNVNDYVANQSIDNQINNSVDNSQSSVNDYVANEDLGNQFVPSLQESVSNEVVNNESVSYEPVMEQNKRNNKKFTISREFKVVIFIVFILLLFILMMPYIYDFFKNLQLIVTG